MSVEFEEHSFSGSIPAYNQIQNQTSGSKFAEWLIRNGLATNTQSANTISLIGAGLIFAISIYIFIYGFNLPTQEPTLDPEVQTEVEL